MEEANTFLAKKQICNQCNKAYSFIELAYWTDNSYKCPACFSSVEITQYPKEVLIFNKKNILNGDEKIIVLVVDGLYIAGVQKHCLYLLKVFKDLGFKTIVISLEGGGLWINKFIDSASCLLLSNMTIDLKWESIQNVFPCRVLEKIQLFSVHLVQPILWTINNIPSCYKIFSNLHSEPSEHEIVSCDSLKKIAEYSSNIIFPSLATLETYMNHSLDFIQNKTKLLVLNNYLYKEDVMIKYKKEDTGFIKIAVISRIDRDKFSIQLLIKTVESLINKGLKLHIRVVGNGDLNDELVSTINAKGLENIIFLDGFIMDISTIYDWAEIIFLPSKREAMPYVMIESISHRCPIVLPKTGYTLYAEVDNLVYTFEKENADNAADEVVSAINAKNHLLRDSEHRTVLDDMWLEKVKHCYFE